MLCRFLELALGKYVGPFQSLVGFLEQLVFQNILANLGNLNQHPITLRKRLGQLNKKP
jgi:hypothetical protein